MFRLSVVRGTLEGKRRFSKEASSRSSGRGHDRWAVSALSKMFLTVPRATPQLPDACRDDSPLSQQRRSTSLIFLMDILLFATFAPCRFGKKRIMASYRIYPVSAEGSYGVAN